MGIGPFRSSSFSSFDYKPLSKKKQIKYPNPKADNYEIIKYLEENNHLILDIKYLDCINYEGRKILVFENCTFDDLIKQKLIDPHFSDNKKMKSPIARFVPTEKGLEMALKFCRLI